MFRDDATMRAMHSSLAGCSLIRTYGQLPCIGARCPVLAGSLIRAHKLGAEPWTQGLCALGSGGLCGVVVASLSEQIR